MAESQITVNPNILNKSKTYVLPYVDEFIKIRFFDLLNNTYLFYNNEYSICLRYDYSGKRSFAEYEKELQGNKYYRSTIDISKREVMFVFDIPEELYEVIDLYTSGKYSYLPNKEHLLGFLKENFGLTTNSKITKIINRDDELRKEIEEELNVRIPKGQDLSSKPDLDNEHYYTSQIDE